LMAVVPDRRLAISHKLTMLKTNRQIVLEALQQLMKLSHQDGNVEKNSHKEIDPDKEKQYEKRNKTEEENGLPKTEIEESPTIPTINVERNNDSAVVLDESVSGIASGKTEST